MLRWLLLLIISINYPSGPTWILHKRSHHWTILAADAWHILWQLMQKVSHDVSCNPLYQNHKRMEYILNFALSVFRWSHNFHAGICTKFFSGFKDDCLLLLQWVWRITKLLKNMLCWRLEGAFTHHKRHSACCYTETLCVMYWFTHYNVCCYTTQICQNIILPKWFIYSHFSFTANWSSPCCSHFPLPYPSWFLAHLFFWAAYIISFIIFSSFLPSFSMAVCLLNKTSHLLFHNYTSLISFP